MKSYIKIHHAIVCTSFIRSFLSIASPILLLSGCSTLGNVDIGDMYERCVSNQVNAINLAINGYHQQSNQILDQLSSQCRSKDPILGQQVNTSHYYKAKNFEEMGNYAQALAEYDAYLKYPNRFVYLDEEVAINRTLLKAKIDTANATAYVNEAESLLNKISGSNARYLVMNVNNAKYDLGIKDEQMLRSYIDAFEYVKNTSADAYNRPIKLATFLGRKKVASEMAKRQQDMRTVDAKAKAMNIPGRLTSTRDASEKTLRMDTFYYEEFKKLRNSFFTNYYAKMLESDMKIQKMNADMARRSADLERRNAEYDARKSSSNNASVSDLIGVMAGAIVSVKTGDSTLLNQAVQKANDPTITTSTENNSATTSNIETNYYSDVKHGLNSNCISIGSGTRPSYNNSSEIEFINNCGKHINLFYGNPGKMSSVPIANGKMKSVGFYGNAKTMKIAVCAGNYIAVKPNFRQIIESGRGQNSAFMWDAENSFICWKSPQP